MILNCHPNFRSLYLRIAPNARVRGRVEEDEHEPAGEREVRGEEEGEQRDAGPTLAERGEEGDADDAAGDGEARQRRGPTHRVHLHGDGLILSRLRTRS